MNVLHKYLETFQIFLPIVIHQVCDKEQKLYPFSRKNANKTKRNPDTNNPCLSTQKLEEKLTDNDIYKNGFGISI